MSHDVSKIDISVFTTFVICRSVFNFWFYTGHDNIIVSFNQRFKIMNDEWWVSLRKRSKKLEVKTMYLCILYILIYYIMN